MPSLNEILKSRYNHSTDGRQFVCFLYKSLRCFFEHGCGTHKELLMQSGSNRILGRLWPARAELCFAIQL